MGSGAISPYYSTVINSTIESCKFLNGSDTNLIAKFMIDVAAASLPKDIFHPCPYVGSFKVSNVSFVKTAIASQFLKGRYKAIVRLFDEIDSNIVKFHLGIEF